MHAGAFFAVVLACYLSIIPGHLDSPDAEVQFRTARSLALGASLAVEPLGEDGFATRTGPDGREYAQYGTGYPMLVVPFYWLGEGLAAIVPEIVTHRVFWPATQYHGGTHGEWWTRFGAALANPFYSAVLALLFFAMARALGLGCGEAWMAGLLHALGTYAWAHSRTFFSEPTAALFLFASFALLFRWHSLHARGLLMPLAAGLLAGFALLVRKDSALFFPGLCLYAALPLVRAGGEREGLAASLNGAGWDWLGVVHRLRTPEHRRVFLGACLAALGMVLGLLAHFAIMRLQFGNALASGYEDQPEGVKFSTPLLAGAYGFLFSAGKGLFFFSPALVPAMLGWPRLARRAPRLAWGVVLTLLPFLVIMAKWQNWAGGWCWGPRHIFQAHVFMALGIVGWLAETQSDPRAWRLRAAAWAWLVVGAAVQIFGASQHAIDYYMLHFRMTRDEPTARALYTPGEAAEYLVLRVEPDGTRVGPVPLALAAIPAPINDSVYVPQNGQWYGYPAMWRAGLHDFFWLHAVRPSGAGPAVEFRIPQAPGSDDR